MNRQTALYIGLLTTFTQSAIAAEVLSELPDQTAGRWAGGFTGLLVGGAAGGPIGAVAGAVVGAFTGSGVQSASGLSERAYQVKTDDGQQQVVRSPNEHFEPGDKVELKGARIVRAAL